MAYRLLLILIIAGETSRSFVSTAPTDNGLQANQDVSDEVQQLEELRKEHDKLTVEHSPIEQNGNLRSDEDSESKHASEKNVASSSKGKEGSRSAIFRHRGITEAMENHLDYEPQKQDNDDFAQFSRIQYSPADLAEYVFRTGDEEGVALAVEELVREGMLGRTDAINYLQDVKEHLIYLKDQYEQVHRLQDMNSKSYPKPLISQRLPKIPREQFVSQLDTEKREPRLPDMSSRTVTTAEPPRQVVTASTAAPKMSTRSDSTTSGPLTGFRDTIKDQEVDPVIIKGPGDSNSLYDEYTLQDVIYQFAKYMFLQSMSGEGRSELLKSSGAILRLAITPSQHVACRIHVVPDSDLVILQVIVCEELLHSIGISQPIEFCEGDQTAEDTLSRLITFLETKVDNKRISREMKEKVLEIISASLVDSLREYPGLLTDDRGIPVESEQKALYRPGISDMAATDKRSLQEKVNQKPLTGGLKPRPITANSEGLTGNERSELTPNALSFQPANSAPMRTKRT